MSTLGWCKHALKVSTLEWCSQAMCGDGTAVSGAACLFPLLISTSLRMLRMIGASLSKLHTSGTALQDACVCRFVMYVHTCGHSYT